MIVARVTCDTPLAPRYIAACHASRPNGLAFDSSGETPLAANVGDPAVPGSFTLSVIDVDAMRLRGATAVPGPTRWAIDDRGLDRFFVSTSSTCHAAARDLANGAGYAHDGPGWPPTLALRLLTQTHRAAVFVDGWAV